MEKDKKKLESLLHHKTFLFIIPNLIIAYVLLYYYTTNFNYNWEVLWEEVVLLFIILFFIHTIVYLFLRKALKDTQKIFCLMCLLPIFYFVDFQIFSFLLFVIFFLGLVFGFKKFVYWNLDYLVGIVSSIVILLFSYVLIISLYDVLIIHFNSKELDYELEFQVEEETESPNMYWLHCDGMLSLETMKKYFNYKNDNLDNFFTEKHFVVNENASLAVGHSTQKALVSLFNPYYYDNFFKDYLTELEKAYLSPNKKMPFVVNYYELEEKRLHNELFQALKKKGYSTIAIAEFNQHTSLYTDYFYDYYYFDKTSKHIVNGKQDLRFMDNRELIQNDSTKLASYIRLNHWKPLVSTTFLSDILENINYLEEEVIDYSDMDLEQYPNIKESNYWVIKAIAKGIIDSQNIESPKFMFID